MRRHGPLLLACVLLAACGGGSDPAVVVPEATTASALESAPKEPGEIVVSGEASPGSHGPYEFEGRYTVRFEQRAPEDPGLDFSAATSFVATLDKEAEIPGADSIELFEAARAGQTRTLRIDGRYYVDVSFGDYPYVIRFTPRS